QPSRSPPFIDALHAPPYHPRYQREQTPNSSGRKPGQRLIYLLSPVSPANFIHHTLHNPQSSIPNPQSRRLEHRPAPLPLSPPAAHSTF
ncbi:hypothetical protein AOQ84DRAFT_444130, partial [Glonium stellatum]